MDRLFISDDRKESKMLRLFKEWGIPTMNPEAPEFIPRKNDN